MSDIASIVVPEWYLAARKAGASEDDLKARVRAFCAEALKRRTGNSNPDVEEELVTMTFDMYEHAIQKAG